MSQWDRVRSSFNRAHTDLFEQTRYSAEFYNYTGGSYNPDSGDREGESRNNIGSATVEVVPPAQDSTVDNDGTSFSWTTSIRLPNSGDGSLTVENGETYTIDIGETEEYETVTVDSGGVLVVNGKLLTHTLTNNGTVDNNGTIIALDGSPGDTLPADFVPLGVDNDKPTEVEIQDQSTGEKEVFELHSYTTEIGSGMVMARLVEQ